jgi:hypothetical protein
MAIDEREPGVMALTLKTDPLHDVLGEAYRLDQLGGSRPVAIAMIRQALADDVAMLAGAKVERDRLANVVRARQQGQRHGCHVSKVTHELLDAALAGM